MGKIRTLLQRLLGRREKAPAYEPPPPRAEYIALAREGDAHALHGRFQDALDCLHPVARALSRFLDSPGARDHWPAFQVATDDLVVTLRMAVRAFRNGGKPEKALPLLQEAAQRLQLGASVTHGETKERWLREAAEFEEKARRLESFEQDRAAVSLRLALMDEVARTAALLLARRTLQLPTDRMDSDCGLVAEVLRALCDAHVWVHGGVPDAPAMDQFVRTHGEEIMETSLVVSDAWGYHPLVDA